MTEKDAAGGIVLGQALERHRALGDVDLDGVGQRHAHRRLQHLGLVRLLSLVIKKIQWSIITLNLFMH